MHGPASGMQAHKLLEERHRSAGSPGRTQAVSTGSGTLVQGSGWGVPQFQVSSPQKRSAPKEAVRAWHVGFSCCYLGLGDPVIDGIRSRILVLPTGLQTMWNMRQRWA